MTRRSSLRQRLLRQFLLLALLPLVLFCVLALALVVPTLLAQAESYNLALATAVRDQVQLALAAEQRHATLVAGEIEAGRIRRENVSDALHALVRQDELLQAAYLTDRRGIVEQVALPERSGLHAGDLVGLDQSAQPHFAEAQRLRQPVWSQTYLSLLSGRITAVLVVPAGERMLFLELALDKLSLSLAAIGASARTQAIVIDSAGRVIAHPDPQLALRQENLRGLALVRRAMAGQPGAERIRIGGADQVAQALPVPPLGWTVLVLQPTRAVLAPLTDPGLLLAAVLLVTLAAAAWLSWLLAQRSGAEVERLALAAEVEAGAHAAAPGMTFNTLEFGTVWARLRTLFDQLHERDRQTESARRDLQAVLDAATEVAIIATELSGRVTVFSAGAQKMLMRTAHGVVGQCTPEAWHDADEVVQRGRDLSVEKGRPISGFEVFVCQAREVGYEVRDWTFVRSDGQRLAVSLAVTAMVAADGELRGFLGVAMDISQRRRADELEVARRSAEAANQAKSAFLSRMSHELRTPLNAVLGYAQLIDTSADEPPSATQRRHLQLIQRSGWHLVQLIDDVLDLARIEAGALKVSIVAVDLRQVVARAVGIVQPLFDKLGIVFAEGGLLGPAATAAALPAVQVDPTRLTQVLVNLLSNAAKYNRRGGSVYLEGALAPDAETLLLRIVDNGLGMSEAQLAQLFQPFNRLGREGGAVEGSGIGLVITRHLLELMHGRLEVASTLGTGSVFTVHLPLHMASEEPSETQQPSLPHRPSTTQTARVLYIEDNEVNALLMRELLHQRPAIELLLAGTVAEGLALCRNQRPDLLLLDMHLPDGDGHRVMATLAADAELRRTPIVVVSADATQAQIDSALAHGAQGYLTKPLDVGETLATIDRLLAQGSPPPNGP